MKSGRKERSERGLVLVIVLFIIAVLMIYTVDMMYFTHVHSSISEYTIGEIRARYVAKSGVHIVGGTMKQKPLESLSSASVNFADETSHSYGSWELELSLTPMERGSVYLRIVDERSKINLNSLIDEHTNVINSRVQKELRTLFEQLEIKPEQSELFLASLINWIDRPIGEIKNDQRATGGDAEFYRQLEQPYAIKNGYLDSLEEIRLIHGMDLEFFKKIKDYVTIYPADKRVNFSTAPRVVLISVLKGAGMPTYESPNGVKVDIAEKVALKIIEYREKDPVVDRIEVREVMAEVDPTLDIEDAIMDSIYATGRSDVFSVTSVGTYDDECPMIKTINAVLRRSGPQSEESINILSWKEK